MTDYSCGSDDITFCADKCEDIRCFRHPYNILHHDIPHSFAYLKDTEYCRREVNYDQSDKSHH